MTLTVRLSVLVRMGHDKSVTWAHVTATVSVNLAVDFAAAASLLQIL